MVATVPSFLSGGGVTGALVRSIDWSRSELGAIDGWPESLKTTVGTILHSRHPMFLWWGRHLVQFYNDAYLPSFGQGKHPVAMGQHGIVCWPEIWPIIEPQIADVMDRAISSWHDDHLVPIHRNGRLEEVYWTYGYSPVFDGAGAVGGTLVVCNETTTRVIGDRRLRTLRLLVERLAVAPTPLTVLEAAADVVALEDTDVPFAMVYRVPANGEQCLHRSVGLLANDSQAVDVLLRDRLEQLASDSAVQMLDRGITDSGCRWPEAVEEVFVARIAWREHTTSGFIVFGLSPRLAFDDSYREYLRHIAECIGYADARVEAVQLRALMEHERDELLEQAPVAIALLSGSEHVFVVANPRYCQMVGRANLVGKTYRDAFPESVATDIPDLLDRVYRTGQASVTHEMRIRLDRTGSGAAEDCFFDFNLEPLRNVAGEVYGMMAVAVDVTPVVTARQVFERAHQERDALLHELERASRAKDEFLAMLGHELRNPLAAIVTALQLLHRRGVPGGEKERAIIERQVTHVVRLVEDLVDVSRIARGTMLLAVEFLSIKDVIAKAIEIATPVIEEHRHQLIVDVPDDLPFQGDATRLSQVVANVLTNAAKYTNPRGNIVLGAEWREGGLRLSVRDNGIGIDPAMLQHVLEPFAQEEQARDRSRGGLGLGLAIVSSVVAAHGGTVALYSNGKGQGTECVICLPFSPGPTV
jgi:signal transduction histidine kinase